MINAAEGCLNSSQWLFPFPGSLSTSRASPLLLGWSPSPGFCWWCHKARPEGKRAEMQINNWLTAAKNTLLVIKLFENQFFNLRKTQIFYLRSIFFHGLKYLGRNINVGFLRRSRGCRGRSLWYPSRWPGPSRVRVSGSPSEGRTKRVKGIFHISFLCHKLRGLLGCLVTKKTKTS